MFPFARVIFVIWIIFWLYWFISAFGSKRNTNLAVGRFVGFRISFFILVILIFSLTGHHTIKDTSTTHSTALIAVGFVIFLIGLALAIWARLNLGKNWGMPMSQKEDPELVTSGPYNYIRHPIYSGILLGALGTALASSVYLFIVFIFMATYFIFSAVMEERLMTKEFPKIYPEYKSRTKMLIPFIF